LEEEEPSNPPVVHCTVDPTSGKLTPRIPALMRFPSGPNAHCLITFVAFVITHGNSPGREPQRGSAVFGRVPTETEGSLTRFRE
jgi:hypothetical protein